MKAPIKGMPVELNRRLDGLDKAIDVDEIIATVVEQVLEQIVIPAATPAAIAAADPGQQFSTGAANNDYEVKGDLFVNSDYVTGDEDATIYFNDTDHSLKFNYGTNRFETDEDIVANSVSLADHNARHENGGADEIDVGSLSGELADLQPVKDHTHQSAGSGVGGKLDHGHHNYEYVCHTNAVVCHNNEVVYY